jgi:hypothetical protein
MRTPKSRSDPKDMIVSLPTRIWHQVETFDDGSELHSIKHSNGMIFFGERFPEALHAMKKALQP